MGDGSAAVLGFVPKPRSSQLSREIELEQGTRTTNRFFLFVLSRRATVGRSR